MDYLIRGILKNYKIRFIAVSTKNMIIATQKYRPMSPLAITALGRLMSVGAMIGMMHKEDNAKVSLRVNGDGPLGLMIVDANTKGEVRGYIQYPDVMLPLKDGHFDVGGGVGKGRITVVSDLGINHPFHSEVDIQSGEIGDDFSYYFTMSEQTPSLVALGVQLNNRGKVVFGGGLIIQTLPDSQEKDFQHIEKLTSRITSLSNLFQSSSSLEEMIANLCGEIQFVEAYAIKYKCGCGQKRFIEAIATLEEEEINNMITQDKGAEITCSFCGKRYQLNEKHLQKSLAIKKKKQVA